MKGFIHLFESTSIMTDQEATRILLRLIKKYKPNIPVIYKEKVIFDAKTIPHSHPKITLNFRWSKAPNPEATLLMLYVHEQLHWFESPLFTAKVEKDIDDHFKQLLNNKKYLLEFPNKQSFIIHLIVLTNEVNIAQKILTTAEYNDVYGDEYWQAYTNTRKYIEANFKSFLDYFNQQQLIWKP